MWLIAHALEECFAAGVFLRPRARVAPRFEPALLALQLFVVREPASGEVANVDRLGDGASEDMSRNSGGLEGSPGGAAAAKLPTFTVAEPQVKRQGFRQAAAPSARAWAA